MPTPEFIEVVDTRTGNLFVARLRTPLHLGRKPNGRNAVHLDNTDKTISSAHGLIEMSGATLSYTDTSTNGTLVDGRLLKRSTASIGERFEIRIRSYVIRPTRANPLRIALVSKDDTVRERADLLPGTIASLLLQANPHRIAVRQPTQDLPANAVASFIHREASIFVSRAGQVPMRLNNREVGGERVEVKAGDVVAIGHDRIELHSADMHRIVCGHAPCRLLNPPQIHALCKWCGHDLANSDSRSRILLPGETF